MKILITGSNGLLGQKLVDVLREDPGTELIATSRGDDRTPVPLKDNYRSMDITVRGDVDRIFNEVGPDVVIHTAA
ncbi:MAG: NAD-dependent epimerase/dehydratase family protein, partial [Bacteroidota bacterium]|nr:NAD-dependent epimerase/dehydratase family protein [Bacteroidota bacterium]